MAKEQTFRSPGFYEREIDLSQRQQPPLGVPAGIVGTAQQGPAFVPITVGSFADFRTKFGGLDPAMFGPYAVNEFLKHRTAVTYMRVLGAGANDTTTDIENTRIRGTVRNAGFTVPSAVVSSGGDNRHRGAVQFIAARHTINANAAFGYPTFEDNDSFPRARAEDTANVVRAMVLMASGTRLMLMSSNEDLRDFITGSNLHAQAIDDYATVGGASAGQLEGRFKLIISSSSPGYATTQGFTGIRVLTASLDPADNDYISKVLNTDPDKFLQEEHLLYADFRVENEIASVSTALNSVAVVSGSASVSTASGDTSVAFRNLFGRFDTRFMTPKTTWFISQPYGTKEFDLFYFETLSDGAYATDKYKVSVANVRKSTDPASEFGSFMVQVRAFDDTDTNPQVIEQFPVCSLDPTSENYIARVVGDMKAQFIFDADQEDERRIQVTGKYPNRSAVIRVVMNADFEKGTIPDSALPFGFRGIPVVKTSDTLTDIGSAISGLGSNNQIRLASVMSGTTQTVGLTGSIVPPLPMTFKVTRGTAPTSQTYLGFPGVNEIIDSRIYWGVKTTRVPQSGSQAGAINDAILNPNVSSVTNPLVRAYTKFLGVQKLDALVTGSGADAFNNNKFTLARVALSTTTTAGVTGSANAHMREAVYVRNGSPNPNDYTVNESLLAGRVTLASLMNLTSSAEFNRFSGFAKFTNIFYGGFDGLNILDRDASRMNDRAASSDTGGGANSAFTSPGLSVNANGIGKDSNIVFSYRTAARIMTDELTVNTNILAIPGIRDTFITDYAADRSKENGLIFNIMDLVEYDEDTNRLFDDSTVKPDPERTAEQFDSRGIDNSYAATWFPKCVIDDVENNRRVKVPASIPALAALAFNDRVGFAWFAPAGFNRGGLDFVSNVDVRLNGDDRDRLYDSRINPIATFPRQGTEPTFVIFGQKTLQQAKSALDRINVRRMLLEVKRIVTDITKKFVFEQNTASTRARWVSQVAPRLAIVQTQAGIESFRVTMDTTNNTQDDINNNRMNGRIVLVPTRTVEFISIDFIITQSGVVFLE